MSQADESRSQSPTSRSNGQPPITCSPREGRSRLIFDESERIAKWCQERLPDYIGWSGPYQAIGYEVAGELKGGVVFTQYTVTNITLTTVLEAPLTRRFLRAVFYYPFLQLQVRRVTALINSRNRASRKLVEKAGFVKEGRLRDAAVDDDVIVYGMLKRECRWIPQ